jgi:hypothetical protein
MPELKRECALSNSSFNNKKARKLNCGLFLALELIISWLQLVLLPQQGLLAQCLKR